MWEGNKNQVGSLESYWMELSESLGVLLRPAMRQLEVTWAYTNCRAVGIELS